MVSGHRTGGRVPIPTPPRPGPSPPHSRLRTPRGHPPHPRAMPTGPSALPCSPGVPLGHSRLLCPQSMSSSRRRWLAWRKRGLCTRWRSVSGPPTLVPHPLHRRVHSVPPPPTDHPHSQPFPHLTSQLPPSPPSRLPVACRWGRTRCSHQGCLPIRVEVAGLARVSQAALGAPGCWVSALGPKRLHFATSRPSLLPQTNWMKSWQPLSRPSVPARVLGLGAWPPWANTGPKVSLPPR